MCGVPSLFTFSCLFSEHVRQKAQTSRISPQKKKAQSIHRVLFFFFLSLSATYISNSETTKSRNTRDDDDDDDDEEEDEDSSDAIPTMLRFFGDELLVYVVVVLVCFFGKHESAITTGIGTGGCHKSGIILRAYPPNSSSRNNNNVESETTSFADLGVPKQIVDLLRNAGIEKPSVAQLAALPELIDLRKLGGENEEDAKAWSVSMPSIAMQSHTGSGKTLAYLIPIFCDILREEEAMEKMDRNQKRHVNDVRAMIVAPSQELAMQIVRTIETVLGPYGKDITQQLIGGANAKRQEEGLRKKRPFIVVGTPGRIAEMSRMGVLKTHGVSTLVIDEADDLLASNFRRDMARINEHCGKGAKGGRRTIICSATLKKETMDAYAYVAPDLKLVLADYEMNKPVESADDDDINKTKDDRKEGTKEENIDNIDDGKKEGEEEDIVEKARREAQMKKQVMINAEEQQVMNRGAVALPPHLQHLFIQADLNRKVDVLRRAVHAMDVQRCLIFVNFGRRSKDVEGKLSARGMPVASLHGDMDKIQRERVLKKFKSGEVRALLVSDLAARGLDIPNCDCVFNLELPTDEVHYVHRAGRTGRMGAPGVVVSISEQKENFVLDKFAQKLGIEIVKASPERGRMNVKGDKATF